MAYVDPVYNTPNQVPVVGFPSAGVSLGTVTASATQTFTGTAGTLSNGVFRFPVIKTTATIKGIRVYCTTASDANVTGVKLAFMNGTSTLASGAAPAVNTYADMTMVAVSTDSHGIGTGPSFFTSTNAEVTMLNTATGTASAQVLGSYAVDFIYDPLFVS